MLKYYIFIFYDLNVVHKEKKRCIFKINKISRILFSKTSIETFQAPV